VVVLLLFIALAEARGGEQPAELVARMTRAEKILLLRGARDPEELGGAGFWPGLPRLGIPPLRFADGPPGINVNRDATAMPAPVGLAATFSIDAARSYGVVLGREARALQQDVVLAPHINIVRDPLFRRNHTTFSEDPFLTAELAAAEIGGIQSQGVMACAKHLAGYNGSDNVTIDPRTLHEIYLPAFEAAVHAEVASVMCAYNTINGAPACENPGLENEILRKRWGFQGFVVSDWGAIHTPLAVRKGSDLEMPGRELAFRPGGPYLTEEQLAAVPDEVIDRAVMRILSQMQRFGMLGTRPRPAPISVEADAEVIRRIASQGAVLLTNRGGLPLSADDLASLAVIGPTGGQLAAGFMGERGYGFEARLVSPVAGLRRLAPRAKVEYLPGVDLTGVPLPLTQPPVLAAGAEFSWKGTLTVREDGDYTLMVQPKVGHGAAGGGTISIDGGVVARTGGPGFGGTGMAPKKWSSVLPTVDGRDNGRGMAHLTAGPHAIELSGHSTGDAPLDLRYAWITPEMRRAAIASAAALATRVHTAVVFAWNGSGPALSLPEDQDALIAAVAEANPRTMVVLNTGGPVTMPWKDKVTAILEMWYPGQEGGWATADILLGREGPGGKLPVTFPKNLDDVPYRSSGVFSEGIDVGYRWYDRHEIEPLFPFGYGLSYTRFEYSDMAVTTDGDGLRVTFNIRNAGSRRGSEVAQVYVGPASGAGIEMAVRSLAGFKRVELDPGRSARVSIHVGARSLSYWAVEKGGWALAASGRTIYVGSSSRDIRLQRMFSPARYQPVALVKSFNDVTWSGWAK
jgi:beta-glucosidase